MIREVAARLYGLGLRLRERRFSRSDAVVRTALPVISIGNLTVGGTGKTPLVLWLAERLRDAGRRPAIVSRGYGGRAGRGPCVVSTGDGPRCGAALAGDEPVMLARALSGVSVVVGADRVRAAREAARLGADCIVLDDGFQHRRIARDLDLVLLDAENPFGGGRLLPAGRLREPLTALRRADAVVITRCPTSTDSRAIEQSVRDVDSTLTVFHADHEPRGFVDVDGRPAEAPSRAVAFCAIGSPRRFERDLLASGVELLHLDARRDHRRFTVRELRRLHARAARCGAGLVTTEKDVARAPERLAALRGPGVLALRIGAVPREPHALVALADRALVRSVP